MTFDELGRWDDGPPLELSEKDVAYFKDACDEKPWSADKIIVGKLQMVLLHMLANFGKGQTKRALAVAGTRHDSSWLRSLARKSLDLQYLLYQHESPEQPHYYESYANEAGAYLRFIHQYYHCLPRVITDHCCMNGNDADA